MTVLASRRFKLFLTLVAGFLVMTIVVAAGWTKGLDHSIGVAIAGSRVPVLNYIALNVTALGGEPVAFITLLIAVLYLASTEYGARGLWIAAPALGVLLTSSLVKQLVHHPRPTTAIIPLPDSYTFPSGHAATACAVWLTLALAATRGERPVRARRVLIGSAIGIALLVAWSRVYLGVHYPSDVVGGLLLGSAWVFVVEATALHPPTTTSEPTPTA
jgi:undecaprenyl-diphosphatase